MNKRCSRWLHRFFCVSEKQKVKLAERHVAELGADAVGGVGVSGLGCVSLPHCGELVKDTHREHEAPVGIPFILLE